MRRRENRSEVELKGQDEPLQVGARILGVHRSPAGPDLEHVIFEPDLRSEADRSPILKTDHEPGQGLVGQVQIVPDRLVVALVSGVVHLHSRGDAQPFVEEAGTVGCPQFEQPLLLAHARAREQGQVGQRRPSRPNVSLGPAALLEEEGLGTPLLRDMIVHPTVEDQVGVQIRRHGLDLDEAGELALAVGQARNRAQGQDEQGDENTLHAFLQG